MHRNHSRSLLKLRVSKRSSHGFLGQRFANSLNVVIVSVFQQSIHQLLRQILAKLFDETSNQRVEANAIIQHQLSNTNTVSNCLADIFFGHFSDVLLCDSSFHIKYLPL